MTLLCWVSLCRASNVAVLELVFNVTNLITADNPAVVWYFGLLILQANVYNP